MYAVVEERGHQFKIEQGDTIRLDRIDGDVGSEFTFEHILLVRGDEVSIGTPTLEGSVVGTIIGHGRGDKVVALKFKRRKSYRRRIGFKPQYTDVRIDRIEV